MKKNNSITIFFIVGLFVLFFLIIAISKSQFIQQNESPQQTITENSPVSADQQWKTYRNDKWGVQFEYPSNWEISEIENDCPKEGTKACQIYGKRILISISLSKDLVDKNDLSKVYDQYYLSIIDPINTEAPVAGWLPEGKQKIREKKVVNDTTWNVYDESICIKDIMKGECNDQEFGIYQTYATLQNNLRYLYEFNDSKDENNPDFQHIINTTVFFPLQK